MNDVDDKMKVVLNYIDGIKSDDLYIVIPRSREKGSEYLAKKMAKKRCYIHDLLTIDATAPIYDKGDKRLPEYL